MIRKTDKISQAQLAFFIIQTQVGVGVLSLPYAVHQVSKGGAWISVLIGGLLAQIVIILQWYLGKLNSSMTLYEIVSELFGKWIGKIWILLYALYFVLIAEVILLRFTDIVGRWVLIETPRSVILFLIAFPAWYLARENIRTIARFYVFSSFLVVAFILLICIGFFDADIRYLFPITEAGWMNIIKGAHPAFIAMIGFEAILMLYPFVEGSPKGILRAVSIANWVVTLFYAFATFTALVVFGSEVLDLVPEPLVYMLKGYSFTVVERVDLIFLSIWVVDVITTLVAFFHFAGKGLESVFNNKSTQLKRKVAYVALFTFLAAIFITDPAMIKFLDDLLANTYYFFFGAGSLLFLLMTIIRNKVKNRGHKTLQSR